MKSSPPPGRRSPMRRSGGGRRRSPVKPVSDRRREENLERRRLIEERWGRYPDCQAGTLLRSLPATVRVPRCDGRAADAHEILFRSRGGSITDTDGMVPVCRPCHTFITEHAELAATVGLARSRYTT